MRPLRSVRRGSRSALVVVAALVALLRVPIRGGSPGQAGTPIAATGGWPHGATGSRIAFSTASGARGNSSAPIGACPPPSFTPTGPGWAALRTPVTPGDRGSPAIASFPTEDQTLLFPGAGASHRADDETWELANGTGTDLTSSLSRAPPPDAGGSRVWDGADGYFLFVGGVNGCGGTSANATWTFADGTSTNRTVSLAGSPPATWPRWPTTRPTGTLSGSGERRRTACWETPGRARRGSGRTGPRDFRPPHRPASTRR